jgi:hypothetical protein
MVMGTWKKEAYRMMECVADEQGVDENDERVTPEQKRRVNEMGTFTVYMCFIAVLGDVGPHTVPEAQVEQWGALSQKKNVLKRVLCRGMCGRVRRGLCGRS